MNNFLENTVRREQFWPTIASIIIPLVQLFAVIIVDINDTLQLRGLFIKAEMLPIANLLTLMLIAACIGAYWYWKENYNWVNFGHQQNQPRFYQKEVAYSLKITTFFAFVACAFIIVSLVFGRSSSPNLVVYTDYIAIIQIISYIAFITSVGIVAYVGLSEYSKKQEDFKPEQYLNNLLSSMQVYGTIPRPVIHIKERGTLSNNRFDILVNLTIDNNEKYLVTSYDGKEILKELSAAEYRQTTTQSNTTPN